MISEKELWGKFISSWIEEIDLLTYKLAVDELLIIHKKEIEELKIKYRPLAVNKIALEKGFPLRLE